VKWALRLLPLLAALAATGADPLFYDVVSDQELGLPADLAARTAPPLPVAIPGRQIPSLLPFDDLMTCELMHFSVPLPQANTRSHFWFQQRRLGRLETPAGTAQFFNPETVLVKFRGQPQVAALRVEPFREASAVHILNQRPDVEFAVLDTFERRQFVPNDPLLGDQWHHQVIGSYAAWNYSLGSPSVQVAIVDSPFQMDHPDLAPNTVSGWDVDANLPVNSSGGIVHSTMCAGLAAAAINNGLGLAGAANCQVLPININGSISEMYNAVIWAADHGVRVVNISWSGATNPVLETAGYYLKTNAAGLLIMSANDGFGEQAGTNQPDVWVVSMTDAADNLQETETGAYLDFAAPGYDVWSTTTGGGYASGSGCSYAAPLVAGVAAWMFGVNPTLQPAEIIGILTNTAVDLGPPGWDPYYGWGRIDFGAAAAATLATLPNISSVQCTNHMLAVAANFRPGMVYSLWRANQLIPTVWQPVANAVVTTNGHALLAIDPSPPAAGAFYRLEASRP